VRAGRAGAAVSSPARYRQVGQVVLCHGGRTTTDVVDTLPEPQVVDVPLPSSRVPSSASGTDTKTPHQHSLEGV
jgi:hypothetical protein